MENQRKTGSKESESAGARTQDLRIKSPLLYQLSYALNRDFRNRKAKVYQNWRLCEARSGGKPVQRLQTNPLIRKNTTVLECTTFAQGIFNGSTKKGRRIRRPDTNHTRVKSELEQVNKRSHVEQINHSVFVDISFRLEATVLQNLHKRRDV